MTLPLQRLIAVPSALALLCSSLLACSSGGSNRGPAAGGGLVMTTLTLSLTDGEDLTGIQVGMTLADGTTLVGVTAIGPVSMALCEENLMMPTIACADLPAFLTPAALFEIELLHPDSLTGLASVSSLTCFGADEDLDRVELTCELNSM